MTSLLSLCVPERYLASALEGQPKAQRVLLAPLRLHRQGSKLRPGGFPTLYFPSKVLALSPRRPLLFRGSVIT